MSWDGAGATLSLSNDTMTYQTDLPADLTARHLLDGAAAQAKIGEVKKDEMREDLHAARKLTL